MTLKSAREFAGLAVLMAVFFSWLFVMSYLNRIRIRQNESQYAPAVFEVTGVDFESSSSEFWLDGSVGKSVERFVPRSSSDFRPKSGADVLARYPRGSKIDVLFNPAETRTIIQGETLRVLHFAPDFWSREDRYRSKLAWFVFLPVPLTLGIYLVLRAFGSRMEAQ